MAFRFVSLGSGSRGNATLIEAGGTRVDCVLPGHPPRAGTVLDLALPSSRLHFFDPETGNPDGAPIEPAGQEAS